MRRTYVLAWCFLSTFATLGQTTESAISQPEQLSSKAWYVLSQRNAGPLLLGLTQRLGKAAESSERTDPIWTGIKHGGSLKIYIAVEGDVSGDIFIGFFKDPHWSTEPVQVRRFPEAGEYVIRNLPRGQFQIGAMIGSLPTATALGVQQMWPEPVEIRRGKTNSVKILVSPDFQRRASGWHNKQVSRDFIGDWKDMDTENLLSGRVTGPGGQSVAFATVQIREYNPGARSIRAPNRGTNEQGYYKYDGINWPYTVGVLRYQLMPSVLGYRHQYLFYNRVFEGHKTVDFQFDDPLEGNATVKGHVQDQKGNPVKEFFIDVSKKMDWDVRKNPDGKFYSMTGYRAPFISKDGSLRLDNLPTGDVDVRLIPFNIRKYEMHRGEEIRLEAGKTTTVSLEVVSKNVLYGRVLFRDESPAVIKPTPWPGAKTSILLTMGARARGIAEVDDEGYFAAYLSDREVEMLESGRSRLIINVPTSEERRRKSMGDFPFEKLAIEKGEAGILRIDHPDIKLLSLIGKSMPELEGIDIAFDIERARDKMILICFFDMEQRPSRNCMKRLGKKLPEFKEKEVVVIAIQASTIEEKILKEWAQGNSIHFPVGMVQDDEDVIRFTWGIKSLPWLILTDGWHVVVDSGFGLSELDAKIKEIIADK
jgi:hypothetical protein